MGLVLAVLAVLVVWLRLPRIVEREVRLSFTVRVTHEPATGGMRLRFHGWDARTDIQIGGGFERRTEAELAVTLERVDADAWLALAGFREWPTQLGGVATG
jgi:hypothetical protein